MIVLPDGLTPTEIRVLQEFRRLKTESLALPTVKAIKHPAGGGEAPAAALVGKGFLTADGETFVLTPKAKEFLAVDPRPEHEEGGSTSDEAAE